MKFRPNKCSTASRSKVMAKSMFSKCYISTGYCMFIKTYFTHNGFLMYGKVDMLGRTMAKQLHVGTDPGH